MARPDDLLFAKSHEWVRAESDGTYTLGITDFAIEQLSDLAYIDLPEVGDSVSEASGFGEVESTKTVAELFSPLSGEVVAVNSEVIENLQLVTSSPFEDGWLIRIRPGAEPDLSSLLDVKGYREHIEAERSH
jgi:glycine cleavage system H protein